MLLEQIWSDAIEVRAPDEMSPLARLLEALLTVPTVALVCHGGGTRPYAMMEGVDLLPGASLGDVLAEELGAYVPRDAVVLVEPVGFADAESVSGHELGQELGRILMELASVGASPLIRADAICPTVPDSMRAALRPMARDFGRPGAEPERRLRAQ